MSKLAEKLRSFKNTLQKAGHAIKEFIKELITDYLPKAGHALKEIIKELITDYLQKPGHALKEFIKELITEYQQKANWGSLATMLTGIVALAAFQEIGPTIAKYQNKELIYNLSKIFIKIIAAAAIWEFICLLSSMHIDRIWNVVHRGGSKLCKWFMALSLKRKWGISVGIIAVAIVGALGWKFLYYDKCTTECFTSIVEIYGIPRGVGSPLTQEEKDRQAGYWQIDEYPNQDRIVLTYVESYQQLEIMKQYSSLYNMQIFQTSARIEYTYEKDEDRFHSYGQDGFVAAGENGYRYPLTISYYGSNGKLLLQLGRGDGDTFAVERYYSEEQPQLLNSTLLRVPDGQKAGNGLASQRIETIYNVDGLPEMRRLNQGSCNLYGVNGERYTYDNNGRMTSLCYLDGDGVPVCNKIGVMLITFRYDNGGNLSGIRYYSDENGTEKTEGFYGVFCEEFSYDSFHNLTRRRQLGRTESWSCDNNGVYQYEYAYDGNTLQEESYLGFDKAVWNKQCGSYSLSFGMGLDNGRKALSIYFNSADTSASNSDLRRVTTVSSRPDTFVGDGFFQSNSNVQETASDSVFSEFADLNKRMEEIGNGFMYMEDTTRSGRKYASIQYIFDNGSLEMKYCDAQGNPVINEYGYAVKKTKFDDGMRVILESYADESRELCYINGGYAAIKYIYENDTEDRLACLEYLDIEGAVTFNTDVGYAGVDYEYAPQDRGEKIIRIYYDANGQHCCIPDKGYAIVEDLYDENGFLIQELYKDAYGAVTCRRDYMVAEILYEYADDGNLILERYKDAYGQPVNRADTGYAVIHRGYEAGHLSWKRYEGYEDQTLRAVPDRTTGIALITYRYERGEKKEEHYFDAKEDSVLRWDTGCASIEYEYNNDGQLLAEYYYGTDGKLILRKDMGCAIARFGYDIEGRRISWRYYGVEEEAVINTKYHCAGIDYVYGERGYRSEICYIGLDGSLMNRDDYGIAVICEEYDEFGNLIGESYRDEKRNPAIRKDTGYASYEDIYEGGHLIERRYMDTEDNPLLYTDEGYATIIYEYDVCGQIIVFRFLGEDKNPIISSKYHCAWIEEERDERGNVIRISYMGLDNTLINRTDYGIAEIYSTYDEFGNIVEEHYQDADGLLAVRKEYGYASCQNVYDDAGHLIESRYLDASYHPVVRKDIGYATIRYDYDKYGQILSKHYYGVMGEPVICTDNYCAGIEYDYDQMGNWTEIRYIGLDGLPMNRQDSGVAKVCREYDSLGNITDTKYYDTEGNPAVWRGYDFASAENIYEYGRLIESRYKDTEGKLVLRSDVGYAVYEQKYNDKNQRIAVIYYDENGEFVNSVDGYAMIEYIYDASGNNIDWKYYDQSEVEERLDSM